MTSRLTRVLLILVLAAAPATARAQEARAGDLKTSIDRLSAFDFPARMYAARMLRRMPPVEVVPALAQAARGHSDQFVRYRALILLTAFNDRGTPELLRELLTDRNDRVREVAYRWYEQNPDPRLTSTLLASLVTEQAEFVRPALIRALAALGANPEVQRALIAEAGRGLDFFRSAVVEALGEHRATYAVETLAAIVAMEGPLQDDATLALGRIGGAQARSALSMLTEPALDAAPALQAAQCLLGDACEARIAWLATTARSRAAPTGVVRAAVIALRAVAAHGNAAGLAALLDLSADPNARLRDEVALAFAGVAVRRPGAVIEWLAGAPEAARGPTIELLRQGFEGLEEDFAEEQFFAATRSAYWAAAERSVTREIAATLINTLEF